MRKPAYLRPTARVQCSCGFALVAASSVGRECWICKDPLVLVGEVVTPDEPMTATEQEATASGLTSAREMLHKTAGAA